MIVATNVKIWKESILVMFLASKTRIGWVVRRGGLVKGCDIGFFLATEVVKEFNNVLMYCAWYEVILIAIVACGI